jgi:hypothetical protein
MFLEDLVFSPSDFQALGGSQTGFGAEMLGQLMSMVAGVVIVGILILLALYIYSSLAYTAIGRKAKLTNPGVAWMPFMGPVATIFECAEAHWWPFLVAVLGFFAALAISLFSITNTTFVVISGLLILATYLFSLVAGVVWHWRTYTAVGKPGWFILVPVITIAVGFLLLFVSPIVGLILYLLGALAHLILIGIAAWSK